jgi:hypothetical protein
LILILTANVSVIFVIDPSSNIEVRREPPLECDLPRKLKPFQFRLRTLIIVTAVVAGLLAIGRFVRDADLIGVIVILCPFILPAVAAVVIISIKLRSTSTEGLVFGGLGKGTLVVCTGLHSVCMLMLATTAFAPDWKGDKGLHWFYYVLDAPAGYTLWPIYWIGAISFCVGVINPNYATRSRLNLAMVVTLAAISAWYTFAGLFLRFCPPLLACVPAAVCAEYCLYAWLVVRHSRFEDKGPVSFVVLFSAWLATLLAAIAAKIPLAMRFYDSLPNQPPQDCFIVTAASRGHGWLVRTWRDDCGRTVNRQLMTFWQLEATLAATAPRFHRVLRGIYNRFAPPIARCIVFRWMADIVYLLLKPLEWTAVVILRRSDRR